MGHDMSCPRCARPTAVSALGARRLPPAPDGHEPPGCAFSGHRLLNTPDGPKSEPDAARQR